MRNRNRIPFLSALELVAWIATAWLLVSVLPAQPGPYSERPFAWALLAGDIVGVSFMVIDVVKGPRRLWLWGLVAGSVILGLNVFWGLAVNDSDLDQWIGWGVMLGGLVVLTMAGVDLITWCADTLGKKIEGRPRRWRVSVEENMLDIARRGSDNDEAAGESDGTR